MSSSELGHVEVLRALGELEATERDALVLIYWHDLTQAQVAAALEISVLTVRATVARGMRQLADRIMTSPIGSPSAAARPLGGLGGLGA